MQFFRYRRRPASDAPDALIADPVAGPPDRRDAFSAGLHAGRHEERARHRGHPMIGLLVALVAVAGAAMLALAIHEGSFSRGGQVVDQNLSAAAGQAQNTGADALARTGQAIQNAGSSLEHKSAP